MSASTLPARTAEPMSHRQTLEALSGLLLVLFVALLSSTVVSTALPQIIGALKGSQTQYTWVVTATLLTATATTPIWGKLADLFDKKLLIQVAIVIFVAGSAIAGLSQNAAQLIAARAFQGIGVGGLQALVQVAIAAMIPPRERGRYNGYLGGVMALATVGGPLLGGLIVDSAWLGWRWCFFVGVPVAVVALVLLQATLHLPTIRRDNVKIDYLGASLIAAGVSLLLIWVSFVDGTFAWLSWQTYAMVGGSLVLLALAVLVESRAAEPVVPLPIVRERTTALAIVASLAVGMAMFGGAVFLGQYFQIGRGYSPTEAGLLTIPLMAGVLLASIVAGRLISRTGRIKPYIVTGTVVLVAGFALLSFLQHDTPLWFVGLGMFARRHRRRHEHAEPRARGAEHGAAAGHRRGQRVGGVLPLARRRDRGLGARRRAGPPGDRLDHPAAGRGRGAGGRRVRRPQRDGAARGDPADRARRVRGRDRAHLPDLGGHRGGRRDRGRAAAAEAAADQPRPGRPGACRRRGRGPRRHGRGRPAQRGGRRDVDDRAAATAAAR